MNGVLYLGGRLLKALLMVVAVLVLSFLLIRLAPGDPALLLAGEAGVDDVQFIEQLRQTMGLDKPLLQQLLIYLGNIAHLDLGYSYRNQTSVWSLISERLPATLAVKGRIGAFDVVSSSTYQTSELHRVNDNTVPLGRTAEQGCDPLRIVVDKGEIEDQFERATVRKGSTRAGRAVPRPGQANIEGLVEVGDGPRHDDVAFQ